MQSACLVFVGSLNREAPYFQGARGVGLGVYSFDEATLQIQKLAETNDVDNPTFLSVTPDGSLHLRQFGSLRLARGNGLRLQLRPCLEHAHLPQQAAIARQHHRAQHDHP